MKAASVVTDRMEVLGGSSAVPSVELRFLGAVTFRPLRSMLYEVRSSLPVATTLLLQGLDGSDAVLAHAMRFSARILWDTCKRQT